MWRDLVAVRTANRSQRRVRRVSSGSKASSSSWLVWLGCHRPVIAAMATLCALAKSLVCAIVMLECHRGAWCSRCTRPSVRQNCVSLAVSTPRDYILLRVHTDLDALLIICLIWESQRRFDCNITPRTVASCFSLRKREFPMENSGGKPYFLDWENIMV